METAFLVAAGLGGAIILCQFLVGLTGLAGDHDVDHGDAADHDASHEGEHGHGGNWFFGVLTIRTLAAAFTFFGLGGMTALSFEAEPVPAFAAALGAGGLALYAVVALMRAMDGLRADGTVRAGAALGRTGTVYLRIPGSQSGPGKVHLTVQNRTVEYAAVTRGSELPTGVAIRVVAVVTEGTLEVEAA